MLIEFPFFRNKRFLWKYKKKTKLRVLFTPIGSRTRAKKKFAYVFFIVPETFDKLSCVLFIL